MTHKGYDGDLDPDSQEGIVERATPRLEKILAKTHDDPNPPSIAKPGYHFDKNGKERKDRGPNKEVSKPKAAQPTADPNKRKHLALVDKLYSRIEKRDALDTEIEQIKAEIADCLNT